jgi:hypothetical protein
MIVSCARSIADLLAEKPWIYNPRDEAFATLRAEISAGSRKEAPERSEHNYPLRHHREGHVIPIAAHITDE